METSPPVSKCASNSEPGVADPIRDRHIEHAKLQFDHRLMQKLDELMQRDDLNGPSRIGLLRFVGHLGDPKLGAAVEACWSSDTSRGDRLDDYLWAFARTCELTTAGRYLRPVCAAWAALPDKSEENRPSPRDQLAANQLRWAFERAIPHEAIDYFITRAQQPDLRWPITYMLHGMDDPRVITFIVQNLQKGRITRVHLFLGMRFPIIGDVPRRRGGRCRRPIGGCF